MQTQQNTLNGPRFIVSPKNYDVTLCDSIEEEQNYTVVLDCAAENSHTVKWSINGKSYSIHPRSTGSVVYSQLTYNVNITTESQIITCTAYGFDSNSVLSTNATISFKGIAMNLVGGGGGGPCLYHYSTALSAEVNYD